MRIIAGEFRSRLLAAPRGMDTRPTSDRLRETLFNVLQPRLEGARFLDLYAGSGANGLEALSRGAVQTVFVEQAAPALVAIRSNIEALNVAGRARVEGVSVNRWLGNNLRAATPSLFELIFLDPPYADAEAYEATLTLLGSDGAKLLAPGGMVVAEHRRERARGAAAARARALKGEPEPAMPGAQYGALHRTRLLEQGDAALSFYAPRIDEPEAAV